MESIGIFEAKTKFPGICNQVVRSGSPVLVSRRGKPLVVISPVPAAVRQERGGIADDWAAWAQAHTQSGDDEFPEVWKLRHDRQNHPFEE
ncbi:MAG: type II toxin-antitoxin system Phd/YefM family antitoxin [Puniceicoccaceae bacterium]|nr:MAG: type II toxin-antitoxin system Phd/YefM family antitoxin [Puniceicoccaceae bacterium]